MMSHTVSLEADELTAVRIGAIELRRDGLTISVVEHYDDGSGSEECMIPIGDAARVGEALQVMAADQLQVVGYTTVSSPDEDQPGSEQA